MTDKKINIDVSNCMYLDGNYCPNHDTKCDFVDNCYFREYKRKEQECEELKQRLECNCFDPKSNNNRCISYNRIAEDYERDLKRLENKIAECEELKAQLNDMACMDDDNVLCYPRQELKKECEKYEQALNEIYLIIDEIKEQYDIWEISELKQIKDIINKVKDGE